MTIKITEISPNGHGVGKINNEYYSVLGTFPGDLIKAEAYKTIGNIKYAKIISFEEPSKNRIYTPKEEPFFDANVPWKYLSLNAENKYKEEFIRKLYFSNCHSIFNLKSQVLFYGAKKNHDTGYRNKVTYTFLDTKKGIKFALYTRGYGKAKKVEQQENILAHPLIEKVGKQFLHFFYQKNIKSGVLKYLILRYSFYTNTITAYILLPETNKKQLPFKKKELEIFLEQHKEIQGILVANSEARLRSTISHKTFYTLGDIKIQEKILEKCYFYVPSLFFQINPMDFTHILKDMREQLKKIKDSQSLALLDLFAGVGIIGIELSDLVHEVIGVELSRLSGKYAIENARFNNIKNFSFKESNVDEALDYIQSKQILVIDPPRRGLTQKTIDKICDQKPQYIFYVSCNPETQYRDYEKIKDLYKITYIKAYNIFPKTHHIESFIVLKRK